MFKKKKTKPVVMSKIVRNIFQEKTIKKKPTETITSGALADKISIDSNLEVHNDVENESFEVATFATAGLCFSCGLNLSVMFKGVECVFCSHIYHLRCLTNEEYSEIRVDDSILFICYLCQNNLQLKK